jgi:glutaredoxin
LLRTEGLEVEERVLDTGQPKLPGVTYYTAQELRQLIPGVRTVPQVLLGAAVIGGLAELQHWLAANCQP